MLEITPDLRVCNAVSVFMRDSIQVVGSFLDCSIHNNAHVAFAFRDHTYTCFAILHRHLPYI